MHVRRSIGGGERKTVIIYIRNGVEYRVKHITVWPKKQVVTSNGVYTTSGTVTGSGTRTDPWRQPQMSSTLLSMHELQPDSNEVDAIVNLDTDYLIVDSFRGNKLKATHIIPTGDIARIELQPY